MLKALINFSAYFHLVRNGIQTKGFKTIDLSMIEKYYEAGWTAGEAIENETIVKRPIFKRETESPTPSLADQFENLIANSQKAPIHSVKNLINSKSEIMKITIEGTIVNDMENKLQYYTKFKNGGGKFTLLVDSGSQQYPNVLPIEFFKGDKGDKVAEIKAAGATGGSLVTVEAYVNGSEWNGKHYLNLRADSIKLANQNGDGKHETVAAVEVDPNVTDDDMPF